MKNNIFLDNYHSLLNIYDTQIAIKLVKDTFQNELSKSLSLTRVSAPLFIDPETGLNDNLNGYEKAVNFICNENNKKLEIVQSLAKWKRYALNKYNVKGLYTDMNAIRPFEELDNIHSLYVDQWDWEKVITKEERNEEYLKQIVRKIYDVIKYTSEVVHSSYPILEYDLPNDIKFITTEELEKNYPNLTRKERENIITKEYKAVFLMHIGNKLLDGLPHDGRAADYDDWKLNGDLLLWYEPLNMALELSSMGIRVDEKSLIYQLKERNEEFKLSYPYHQNIINSSLPLTIGGGIGQSRISMFMLKKVHIGEVQASYWDKEDIDKFKEKGIELL